MKRFYSVPEAAQELEVSPQTVRNRIRSGALFAVQSTKRGAFKIHAQSLVVHKEKIGMLPAHRMEVPPMPEPEIAATAEAIYRRQVEPVLETVGVRSMSELIARAESDADYLDAVRDVLPAYKAFVDEAVGERTLVASAR